MRKWSIVGLVIFAVLNASGEALQNPAKRLSLMFDRDQNIVYVAAHRGDWRDAPENSIPSLQFAERLGVDIVELDLKKTKDGRLVVMHDKTLNRTTTGSGLVSDYDLDQIEHFTLRAGTGHPTRYRIPTFSEELTAARNKTILDIDQGWSYFPEVVKELRATNMMKQVIVNVLPNTSYQSFLKKEGTIPDKLAVMIVVDMKRPDAEEIIRSYRAHKRTIVQCIFGNDESASVHHIPVYRTHFPVWINSLWPDQNAGHDDERAVEQDQPNESWGWLISHGADILQTDRPRQLLKYLQQRNLHR